MVTLSGLKPMSPKQGPPLPQALGIYWPWVKGLPTDVLKVVTPSGTTEKAPAPILPSPIAPISPAPGEQPGTSPVAPIAPAPTPPAALVPVTDADIARLTEDQQKQLQDIVAGSGDTAQVLAGTNVVAVITPWGSGSAILPTADATAEQVKAATAAVQQQMVQQGVITVDPATGIATPTQPAPGPSGSMPLPFSIGQRVGFVIRVDMASAPDGGSTTMAVNATSRGTFIIQPSLNAMDLVEFSDKGLTQILTEWLWDSWKPTANPYYYFDKRDHPTYSIPRGGYMYLPDSEVALHGGSGVYSIVNGQLVFLGY